jgi:hypothetical protein
MVFPELVFASSPLSKYHTMHTIRTIKYTIEQNKIRAVLGT